MIGGHHDRLDSIHLVVLLNTIPRQSNPNQHLSPIKWMKWYRQKDFQLDVLSKTNLEWVRSRCYRSNGFRGESIEHQAHETKLEEWHPQACTILVHLGVFLVPHSIQHPVLLWVDYRLQPALCQLQKKFICRVGHISNTARNRHCKEMRCYQLTSDLPKRSVRQPNPSQYCLALPPLGPMSLRGFTPADINTKSAITPSKCLHQVRTMKF